jgi:hypothetical protein
MGLREIDTVPNPLPFIDENLSEGL